MYISGSHESILCQLEKLISYLNKFQDAVMFNRPHDQPDQPPVVNRQHQQRQQQQQQPMTSGNMITSLLVDPQVPYIRYHCLT